MPTISLSTKIFKSFVFYCYFWRLTKISAAFYYCRLFLTRIIFLLTIINAEFCTDNMLRHFVPGDMVVVRVKGETREVKKEECDQMNPPKYEKCTDMSNLTFLNEASVLYNLSARY